LRIKCRRLNRVCDSAAALIFGLFLLDSLREKNMVANMADILRMHGHMNDELGVADYTALALFQEHLQRAVESTAVRTRQAGLEPLTFTLLLALRRQPPGTPATINELSSALGWNRGELVELLDALVRRGFVARTRDRSDRRRFLISLTPAGEQWLTPLAKEVLHQLAVVGPDLLRTVRVAVSHAAANVARVQPPPRADISNFAWRAVGSTPI
jgi:DNA-binding MarR family transcriptional regulator